MDNKKSDIYYIEKAISELEFLIRHTIDITMAEFETNEILIDSVMFRFIQISEHLKKLSSQFKESNKEIPWRDIMGLRNRIVHEYGNVDLNIIYDAIKVDIYKIYNLFKSIKIK